MIGTGGDRALRIVAEHADIWNCPARTAEEFRDRSQVLDAHCAAIGRDPGSITRSVQLVLRGELSAARDQLGQFLDAGANHLVIAPVPPVPPLARLVEEIVEPLRARYAARTGG
jgi:alkanesulfonate monooxygenase SsuD/methylene tetrahydromethanopterin reductase-like flavin-dependent oxidoreductase (luciferase family)